MLARLVKCSLSSQMIVVVERSLVDRFSRQTFMLVEELVRGTRRRKPLWKNLLERDMNARARRFVDASRGPTRTHKEFFTCLTSHTRLRVINLALRNKTLRDYTMKPFTK